MSDRKPIINCKFTRMKKENGEWKNIKINPFKDILKDLVNYNNELEDTVIGLQNEVKKWKEYNKDEEINNLISKIDDLKKGSIYILSEEQRKQMNDFRHEHYKKHDTCRYSIICTPTGVYTNVTIKCNICGEELDISII